MVINDEQSLKTTLAFLVKMGCGSIKHFKPVTFLFSIPLKVKVGLWVAE